MQIAIPSLRRGRHVFESTVAPDAYPEAVQQAGVTFRGDIRVRAVVHKIQEEVFVQAEAEAPVGLECARCTEPFEGLVRGTLEALYLPDHEREGAASRTDREENESQRVFHYSGGLLDLGEGVIEAVLLAVPMKPLCRPDCRGLCPRCGKNLNQGPCDCPRDGPFGTPLKGLLGDA